MDDKTIVEIVEIGGEPPCIMPNEVRVNGSVVRVERNSVMIDHGLGSEVASVTLKILPDEIRIHRIV